MKTRKNIYNKQNMTKKVRPYTPFEKKYMEKLTKGNNYKGLKYENEKLIEELNLKNENDSKTDPKNDFYTYVNERWLKNKDIYTTNLTSGQKYISQVDDFRLVQDTVYKQLENIVNDYIKNNSKTAKCMKNFYESTLKGITTELGMKYVKESIGYIDELRKDKNNLWKLLAIVNSDESIKPYAPFCWNVVTDRKNSEYYISEISPHYFIQLDYQSYYKNDKEKKKFIDYVKKLFIVTKSEITNYNDVFDCATELFKLFSCNNFKEDINGYNIVSAEEALEKYNFDWKTFAKELGYKKIPQKFVATNINYLSCCCKLLSENWNSEKWRPWWIWLFIRRISSFTEEWEKVFYSYYAKQQLGIEMVPSIRGIILTSLPFNTTISNEYVKRYYDGNKVEYIKGFIEDLKLVFMRIIENNTWMNNKTKKYALKKLYNLKFDLVMPKKLMPDPLLDYKSDDIYNNLKLLSDYRTKLFVSLDGKKITNVPSLNWTSVPPKLSGYQCYVVNAMYIPTKNSIYIPLGYMQEPFIDLDNRGIEYNLSNIGFTICHEMSHCLDDMGSKYDYKGNLNDWWTPSDKKKFKKIQKNILDQYSAWTKRDGLKFDPQYSLGEDLADISGLYICETYLLDFMKNKKSLIPIISNSMNTFHTYFAAQQKQKISKSAEKAQVVLNPHPPNKYRCNIPISRSVAFRGTYDIKKGDKMWWHNTERIW